MMTIKAELPRDAAAANFRELTANGLEAALAAAEARVRERPGDLAARGLLFDLFCLGGHWNRAVRQLQAAAGLDASRTGEVQALRLLIAGEEFRAEVFAGRRRPAADDPPPWLEKLLAALAAQGAGQTERADELREQAFEEAPASPGRLTLAGGESEFSWLADSDSRLGPVLELYAHGRYEWLPFERVARLTLAPPACPRDLVWLPARLSSQGREREIFLPARYPGSERAADPLRLGRETEWTERGRTGVFALGAKVWCTEGAQAPAFETRALHFEGPAS